MCAITRMPLLSKTKKLHQYTPYGWVRKMFRNLKKIWKDYKFAGFNPSIQLTARTQNFLKKKKKVATFIKIIYLRSGFLMLNF